MKRRFLMLWMVLGVFVADAQNTPVITNQPASQAVVEGGIARFTVGLSGSGPFRYQWLLNGTNLPNVLTTVAGNGTVGYSGEGGSATAQSMSYPSAVAVDTFGNIFIADTYNQRIRKVDTNGFMVTVAGNGSQSDSGDGGPATSANLAFPSGVAVDASGNLFIADTFNQSIRKVDANGIITTVAGIGVQGRSGDGGPATNAALSSPAGVAVDAAGNLFIADTGNQSIRKVDANGIISTIAGNGLQGNSGDGGAATNAALNGPSGIAIDTAGNLFMADTFNQVIQRVDSHGFITTVAGTGKQDYSGDGGPATNAALNNPSGVAVDAFGNIYIADSGNERIRRIGPSGIITTAAGNGAAGYSGDGAALSRELNAPSGLTLDGNGNVFIADTANERIRELIANSATVVITNAGAVNAGEYQVIVTGPDGSVTSSVASLTILYPPTIIQNPANQVAPVGGEVTFEAFTTGTPPLSYQWFFGPAPIPGATNRTLTLPDLASTNTGGYTLVASNPYGAATSSVAQLLAWSPPAIVTQPADLIVMSGGNAIFTPLVSGTGPFIYQWQFNGTNIPPALRTVAGVGTNGVAGDGGPANKAEIDHPTDVAVDLAGNFYLADQANNRVRKIDTIGIISTFAGNGTQGYSGDGAAATNAELNQPAGVAVDAFGNVFVADYANHRVRKVDTNGIITTVAGFNNTVYPAGLAVDGDGNLFVACPGGNVVVEVAAGGEVAVVAGNGLARFSGDEGPANKAALNGPSGVALDAFANLFIADAGNNRIRKVDSSGIITSIAGNGTPGYNGDGVTATNSDLYYPSGVAVDGFGNLYIADQYNSRIREIGTNGSIATIAGTGVSAASGDGLAPTNTALSLPYGVTVDPHGNLFIADTQNARLRELSANNPALTLNGVVATNAGEYGVIVTSPYGSVTSSVASLTVLGAPFITENLPSLFFGPTGGNAGIAVSAIGTAPLSYKWYFGADPLPGQTNSALVLADLRQTNAGNYFAVISNSYGSVTSSVASFHLGVAPSLAADLTNQTVAGGASVTLTVVPAGTGPFTYSWLHNGANISGIITTVAGSGTRGFSGDGGPATSAALDYPFGVVVDPWGDVFIADTLNAAVREVGSDGIISTIAGGPAPGFQLGAPYGLALDGPGYLLIADAPAFRVWKLEIFGGISTFGGAALSASLELPQGVLVDSGGNVFVSDEIDGCVFRVDSKGVVSIYAGDGYDGFGGDGGPATNASFVDPAGMAMNAKGELFIADPLSDRVRKVDTNGIISTVAGGSISGTFGDNGFATNALLYEPFGLAIDADGSLLIADAGNSLIRKIQTNGIIVTVAGNGVLGYSGDGGPATNAALSGASGIAVDSAGSLYIADTQNNRIRKVSSSGPSLVLPQVTEPESGDYQVVVTSPYGSVTSSVALLTVLAAPSIAIQPKGGTFLAGGSVEFSVSAVGSAPLSYQWFLAGAPLAGQTNRVLDLENVSTPSAGSYSVLVTNLYGSIKSAGAVLNVGFAPSMLVQPGNQTALAGGDATLSVLVEGTGPLNYQWLVNGVALPGSITTVAGNGNAGYSGDGGPATNATLSAPYGLTVDGAGNLFIADTGNARIRKIDRNGVISTIAGNGKQAFSGDGGPATNAALNNPRSVVVDPAGNLFIGDYWNFRVRKVDPSGIITTFAGGGTNSPGDGGAATNAALGLPISLALDASGNLYSADAREQRIRKIDTSGIITTAAGNGVYAYAGDGGPATNASVSEVEGLAVNGAGNLVISDTDDMVIREVVSGGDIFRVAGDLGIGFAGDGGLATSAALNYPEGVAVDVIGNIYIADLFNNRIREVDTSGIISTVVGNGTGGFSGDGGLPLEAELNNPYGVALDAFGALYILDTGNQRVRKAFVNGPTLFLHNLGPTNSGDYQLVVSSPYGSATSGVSRLTVVAPFSLGASITPANALILKSRGAPGQTYVLQSASSLVAPIVWQPVYTNLVNASGVWSFTNAAVTAQPAVFYRIAAP